MNILNKIVITLFTLVVVLSCKKSSDEQPNPTSNSNTNTEIKPGINVGYGAVLISQDEYNKIPLINDPQINARVNGTVGKEPTIPSTYDISSKMPPVGNQGMQNSCVAWAVAYASRSYWNATAKNTTYLGSDGKLNEEAIFSPSFIYNQINKGLDNGSSYADALELMKNVGVCTLKDMAYSEKDYTTKPTSTQLNSATNYKIKNWGRINISEASFKRFLYYDYPIIIATQIDDNFKKLSDKLPNGEYIWKTLSVNGTSGHAMVIVGFDNEKKAFKVQNSWSDKWANKGFIWLDYELLTKVIREAYITLPIEKSSSVTFPIVQTDPAGVVAKNGDVTLNGSILELGSTPIIKYGFCISESNSSPTEQTEIKNTPITGSSHKFSFNSKISSENGAVLHYRAFVQTPDEIIYGNTISIANSNAPFSLILGCHANNGTRPIEKRPGVQSNEIQLNADLKGFGTYTSFDNHGFYLYPISVRRADATKQIMPIKIDLGKVNNAGTFQTIAKNLAGSTPYAIFTYVKPNGANEVIGSQGLGCLYQTRPEIIYAGNSNIAKLANPTLKTPIACTAYSVKNKTLYYRQSDALFSLKEGETTPKLLAGKTTQTYIPEPIDGATTNATFSYTEYMVADNLGNIYTKESSEKFGTVIRKVTADGTVSTLIKSSSKTTMLDGNKNTASFIQIKSMVCDKDNNIWVIDNKCIRKITPNGDVTTFAGDPKASTSSNIYADGSLNSTRFAKPVSLAIDDDSNIYVLDRAQVRKITANGSSTIAGRDKLYSDEFSQITLLRSMQGTSTIGHYTDAPAKAADFYDATQIFHRNGELIIVDNWHPANQANTYFIRKILADGSVRTIAGKLSSDFSTLNAVGVAKETFLDGPAGLNFSSNQFSITSDKLIWGDGSVNNLFYTLSL